MYTIAQTGPGQGWSHKIDLHVASLVRQRVRIIAAEALGRYGNNIEAKRSAKVLMQYADPAKNGICLSMLALNALDVIGEHANPHKEAIAKMSRIDPVANPRMRNYANRLIGRIVGDSR